MTWLNFFISYVTLLVISLIVNKRQTSLERYIHNALVYIPLALFLLVYCFISLFMLLLNSFLTSRLFFTQVRVEDCPVGEENKISTILTPIDKFFNIDQKGSSSADGLFRLRGEFSFEKFKSAILNDFAFAKGENSRLLYPKLTQVVKERFLFSTWEYYPNFNIDNHITQKWLDLSMNEELQSFMSTIHSSSIPRGLPGFQFYVIHDKNTTEYTDGTETYIVYRLDHTMGDGITFVRIFMNSLGKPLTESDSSKLNEMFQKYSKSQYTLTFGRLLLLTILSPIYLANLLQFELKNFFYRPPTGKVFSCYSPDLDFTKVAAIKNKTNTSVNDVFLMLTGQALQAYMIEKGEDPISFANTSFAQAISLNVTLAGSMANNIVAIRMMVPVQILHWRDQLKTINARMLALKSSLEPIFVTIIILFTSYFPKIIRTYSQTTIIAQLVSGVFSNIPGPDIRMTLAGTPIDKYVIFLPLLGLKSIGVGFISVGGKLCVSVTTDRSVCSEPEKIHTHLIRRLDEIYKEVANIY
ncbi:diacylglycerol O-acyltransferase [Oopsacas minuta]|uniref:Diacylglycerol O-acyltransferase n=1 Tax=Oopsacas minuta TaxID=111878 RepID=A0AAV7JCI8_9METZ|nr:diacylglycerol O-acyltransferase [Oopsacas minuta]